MSRVGIKGTVDPIAVVLTGPDFREIDVPDLIGIFLHRDGMPSDLIAEMIEQAQLHPRGVFREKGEVGPPAIPRRAKRIGTAGPDSHGRESLMLRLRAVMPIHGMGSEA